MINLCIYKSNIGIDAEWFFFITSHGKSPCDRIDGAMKRHAAKRSLQRLGVFRFNQILDYEAIITLIPCISVNQFDRHNLGYKKQVIWCNQVYFSSSNVSTDATVIIKDWMLNKKITIKWNLTKLHTTRLTSANY